MILTPSIIDNLRRHVERSLYDTCVRLVYSAASGGYGHGSPTYTAGDSLPCRFDIVIEDEAQASGQVYRADGKLTLALDDVVDHRDRVRITHLHGEAIVSPQTFEIVAGPIRDHTSQRMSLRLVTE